MRGPFPGSTAWVKSHRRGESDGMVKGASIKQKASKLSMLEI